MAARYSSCVSCTVNIIEKISINLVYKGVNVSRMPASEIICHRPYVTIDTALPKNRLFFPHPVWVVTKVRESERLAKASQFQALTFNCCELQTMNSERKKKF